MSDGWILFAYLYVITLFVALIAFAAWLGCS